MHLLATPLFSFSRDRRGESKPAEIEECRDLPSEPYFENVKNKRETTNYCAANGCLNPRKKNQHRKEKILTDSRLLFVRFLSIKAKTTCKKTDIKKRRNNWRKTKHKSQWLKLTTSEKLHARVIERERETVTSNKRETTKKSIGRGNHASKPLSHAPLKFGIVTSSSVKNPTPGSTPPRSSTAFQRRSHAPSSPFGKAHAYYVCFSVSVRKPPKPCAMAPILPICSCAWPAHHTHTGPGDGINDFF